MPLLLGSTGWRLPSGLPLPAWCRWRFRALADSTWIRGPASSTCPDTIILLRACQSAGFEPRIAFTSDDYLAIQGFVAAGVGAPLIPEPALLALRGGSALRPLPTRPPVVPGRPRTAGGWLRRP